VTQSSASLDPKYQAPTIMGTNHRSICMCESNLGTFVTINSGLNQVFTEVTGRRRQDTKEGPRVWPRAYARTSTSDLILFSDIWASTLHRPCLSPKWELLVGRKSLERDAVPTHIRHTIFWTDTRAKHLGVRRCYPASPSEIDCYQRNCRHRVGRSEHMTIAMPF
jgi:hypothetical protein